MKLVLIIGLLGYSMLMLAQTIVAESMGALLFGVLVLVLGNALCKATNWMDKETENEDT